MILDTLFFTLIYASIETGYRFLTNGSTTTIGQTIITFIWSPIIIKHFHIIPYPYNILIFPVNIWLCEIVSGYYVLLFYNTRLWYYSDNLSFCNHFISLYFSGYWIILGYCINKYINK